MRGCLLMIVVAAIGLFLLRETLLNWPSGPVDLHKLNNAVDALTGP